MTKDLILKQIEEKEKELKEGKELNIIEKIRIKDEILDLKRKAGVSNENRSDDNDCLMCSG